MTKYFVVLNSTSMPSLVHTSRATGEMRKFQNGDPVEVSKTDFEFYSKLGGFMTYTQVPTKERVAEKKAATVPAKKPTKKKATKKEVK